MTKGESAEREQRKRLTFYFYFRHGGFDQNPPEEPDWKSLIIERWRLKKTKKKKNKHVDSGADRRATVEREKVLKRPESVAHTDLIFSKLVTFTSSRIN